MWKFLVKNQSIEVLEREVLADHQIQYVQFRFTFDGDWRRFHKVVQFSQCDETYNIVLGTDGTSLYLPAELHVGAAKMSVFGYDTESDTTVRATTVPVTLNIRPSGFVGDNEPPIPPTPDLYTQLLKKIEEAGHGADGKSAYEIAVEHGYVGTEEEWLASLKGEPGETPDMSEYPKTSEVTTIVEREIEAATGDLHSHANKATLDALHLNFYRSFPACSSLRIPPITIFMISVRHFFRSALRHIHIITRMCWTASRRKCLTVSHRHIHITTSQR